MTDQQKARQLIKVAQDFLKERYELQGHHIIVAAALLTTSGHIYKGLHIGTTQPSVATCAEIATIGIALASEKNMQIDMIVAVRDPEAYIISPCGKCREYIADYGPDAQVVVPLETDSGWGIVPISSLLPLKYKKRTRSDQIGCCECKSSLPPSEN